MNIEDFSCGVLMEAMPSIPSAVLEMISDDMAAGELFTSLIEVIERAPQAVSTNVVDAVAEHLVTLPEGVHRQVGLDAVATYRRLLSA